MNIFVLDTNPVLAARYHCDKHVVKMCIEYAQILSTAARAMGHPHEGYKSTHANHPCTLWAGEAIENWSWVYHLAIALGDEFTHRYGKVHKSTEALQYLPISLQYGSLNSPVQAPLCGPQAMPDSCKNSDIVLAYRNYYLAEKRDFATWTSRPKPHWWINESSCSPAAVGSS